MYFCIINFNYMIIKEFLKQEYVDKRKSQNVIAKEQDLPLHIIEYLMKMCNLTHSRSKYLYVCNEDKFDLDNPIFWYYTGLIATDGYINSKNNIVALKIRNEDAYRMLSKLISYFEYNGRLFKYGKDYEFRINSPKLISILNSVGIPDKNKTFKLLFPNSFPSDDCKRMYFRGIHDGDGNIHRSQSKKTEGKWLGGAWRILTGSFEFLEGLAIEYNSVFNTSYIVTISSRKNDKIYPEFRTGDKDGKRFIEWLYKDFDEYKLIDKYEKAMSVFNKI